MGQFNPCKLDFPEKFDSYEDMVKQQTIEKAPKYYSLKKAVVSDCDGILTDGRSYFTKNSKYLKSYGSYDKEAMTLMVQLGWDFRFVSHDIKEGLDITASRIEDLKMKLDAEDNCISFMPASPKQRADLVKQLKEEGYDIVLFIGDSLSDIKAISLADYGATTRNAPAEVKEYCDFISDFDGGAGGFADILMTANTYFTRTKAKTV